VAKLLVVDDDEDVRELVARRLRNHGHAVVVAANADEALAVAVERGAPDLVVLDVAMPGMTGLTLLDELRSLHGMEDLPAVFLSARVQEPDIAAGRARDAVYLTKPFVASALLASVDRLLAATDEHSDTW